MKNRLVLLALALAALSLPASAHHSSAIYNKNNEVTASGIVTDWFLGWPHPSLTLVGTNDSGEEETYTLDFGGISAMVRANEWNEETFQPGDRVSVTGSPSRMNPTTILVDTLVTEIEEFATPELPPRERGGPPMFAPVPEEITLPFFTMFARVTESNWTGSRVIVTALGEPPGQTEAIEVDIYLPDADRVSEFNDFNSDDIPEGTPLLVEGFLVEESNPAMFFPRIFNVVDGKSMRIEQNGLLLAHQHLGLDYTPLPETATGGRGPPGGAGRAGRGERGPPGGFTPTPFGRDDFPGFGPPASDTGEESDNTGQE